RRPLPPPPATSTAPATTADRTVDLDRDGKPDRTEAPVVADPKPRTSLLATLGLVVSIVGAAAVLTGTLAGYGIALGAVGAVLSVLGLIATRRRHVAGTTDALIGMSVGLAAVVLGIIAMTGQFAWPTTDGDQVARLREWLDSQFARRV
ncbi:thrombospondin, partial [Micromonospora sp. KC213]